MKITISGSRPSVVWAHEVPIGKAFLVQGLASIYYKITDEVAIYFDPVGGRIGKLQAHQPNVRVTDVFDIKSISVEIQS